MESLKSKSIAQLMKDNEIRIKALKKVVKALNTSKSKINKN